MDRETHIENHSDFDKILHKIRRNHDRIFQKIFDQQSFNEKLTELREYTDYREQNNENE
jgi:hypothetical protein